MHVGQAIFVSGLGTGEEGHCFVFYVMFLEWTDHDSFVLFNFLGAIILVLFNKQEQLNYS